MHMIIAVHGGAGVHHPSSDKEVKRALRHACSKALDALLHERQHATCAVRDAISVLEDEPCLNAGYGSNLSLQGKVECDAALIDGRTGDFGSVGAVSGVKNPIQLAHAILDYSRAPDRLGRIPPLTLVSDGAHRFAESCGLEVVSPETLVAARATAEMNKWITRLHSPENKLERLSSERQDTVGAVAWDADGNLAAGVSSGGLLLKLPGRVGEAAVFGAGCWARQWSHDGTNRGLACSVSGAGEHITRTALARSVGDALHASPEGDTHEIIRAVLVDEFWKPLQDRGVTEADAGILLLTKEDNGDGQSVPRLWCAFTTDSMAVAYTSSTHPTPKAVILRRSDSSIPNSGIDPPLFITALPL